VPFFACVALLLGLASPVSAARLGSWGFRSGISVAHLSSSIDALETTSHVGFAGGFSQQITLSRVLSIQPELWWVSKGAQDDVHAVVTSSGQPPEEFDFHYEYRLDYIEVPLLARLGMPTASVVQPYIVAGPAMAFRVGSKSTVTDGTGNTLYRAHEIQMADIFEDVGTFAPDYRKIDWGMIGGGGVLLGRGPVRFGLEARYTHGLGNVFPGTSVKMHNRALAVTAGIELQ